MPMFLQKKSDLISFNKGNHMVYAEIPSLGFVYINTIFPKCLYSYRKRMTEFLLTKKTIWFMIRFSNIGQSEMEKLDTSMSNHSGGGMGLTI